MLQLVLEKRDTFGKKLFPSRKMGKLPVVVYGSKHKSGSYFVSVKDFKKIWKEAGESTLVSLKEDSKNYDVLIQEVDTHPLSGEPIHADFYAIDINKPVEVKVAVEFVGVSPAVKNLGAILVKVMHELEIEMQPKDLPAFVIQHSLGRINVFGGIRLIRQ